MAHGGNCTQAEMQNMLSSIETTADKPIPTRSAIPARIASGASYFGASSLRSRNRLVPEQGIPVRGLIAEGWPGLGTTADRKPLWLWAGDAYTCRRPRPSRSRKGWVSWPSLSSACLRPPVLLPGLQPPDPAGPVGTRTRRVNPDPRDRGGQPLIRRVHSNLVFHD
jgi:hypothetical protein